MPVRIDGPTGQNNEAVERALACHLFPRTATCDAPTAIAPPGILAHIGERYRGTERANRYDVLNVTYRGAQCFDAPSECEIDHRWLIATCGEEVLCVRYGPPKQYRLKPDQKWDVSETQFQMPTSRPRKGVWLSSCPIFDSVECIESNGITITIDNGISRRRGPCPKSTDGAPCPPFKVWGSFLSVGGVGTFQVFKADRLGVENLWGYAGLCKGLNSVHIEVSKNVYLAASTWAVAEATRAPLVGMHLYGMGYDFPLCRRRDIVINTTTARHIGAFMPFAKWDRHPYDSKKSKRVSQNYILRGDELYPARSAPVGEEELYTCMTLHMACSRGWQLPEEIRLPWVQRALGEDLWDAQYE
jgi:hypothetical protein